MGFDQTKMSTKTQCRPKHDVDQIGVGQNSGVDQTGNFETIATKCGSTK